MLNAHTDTVQRDSDKDVADFVEYVWMNDAYTGNGKMLGGDDKCGIAVVSHSCRSYGSPDEDHLHG